MKKMFKADLINIYWKDPNSMDIEKFYFKFNLNLSLKDLIKYSEILRKNIVLKSIIQEKDLNKLKINSKIQIKYLRNWKKKRVNFL